MDVSTCINLWHSLDDVWVLVGIVLLVAAVHAGVPALAHMYLSTLAVVLVLAGEVHPLKPPQDFLHALCRVSQHGLQGDTYMYSMFIRNRLMSFLWTITHVTCWQNNRNVPPSGASLPEEPQEGEALQSLCQQVTCIIVHKIDINLLRLSMPTNF